MLIQYTWYYRWGDKGVVIYNLDRPGSRTDLRNAIQKHKDGKESKDVTHYEFHVIRSISSDEVLKELDK